MAGRGVAPLAETHPSNHADRRGTTARIPGTASSGNPRNSQMQRRRAARLDRRGNNELRHFVWALGRQGLIASFYSILTPPGGPRFRLPMMILKNLSPPPALFGPRPSWDSHCPEFL
jgi:hypothetical protein